MDIPKKSDEGKQEPKERKSKKPSEKEKIDELTDDLQRLQAEFENYRKRIEKEKEEFAKYAKAEVIAKLLHVLDTFEIALKSSKDSEKFNKGMEMVYAQFLSALGAEGLRPIHAAGKPFDHNLHEVMLKQKSDKEDGIVLEELQKGYMFKDRVLRYAKVKVSEKEEKDSLNAANNEAAGKNTSNDARQ